MVRFNKDKVILFSIFTYYTLFVQRKTYKSPLRLLYCPPGPLPESKGIPWVGVKKISRLYLLNALSPAMFVVPVTIELRQITAEEAKVLMQDKEIVNAVGHQATVDIMNLLLGTNLVMNRIQVKIERNEEAIIFGLLRRLEEGKVLRTVEELNVCSVP